MAIQESPPNLLEKCREKAFRLLEIRQHTVFEMKTKLRKQFTTTEIFPVVEDLLRLGYLNDTEFARNYLTWRIASHGLRRITHELKRRGVSQTIIQEIQAEWLSTHPQEEQSQVVEELAQRKWRTIRDKTDLPKAKLKVARFLAQRGFDLDLIWQTISQLET